VKLLSVNCVIYRVLVCVKEIHTNTDSVDYPLIT